MGVTGLWTVVQPCARPIKIDTLNKKRLAVDASIWLYQFLKAVRDKEGNALRNSNVVGFFRRICKLLFFGIKPVFVFDGGAPALKRQTISGRKNRREGRREDAARTAGKLLALQMQRRAEEAEQKRKDDAARPAQAEEEAVPDELVYVDELQMTNQERQQNRKFKKKDAYHLPELDASLAEMGGPNDPRIMSLEELEQYARQFDTGEDINVYDFSKIDFDSPFFTSLPASDRYNILNAARLRSRLRMGYSKEQLDDMFPDRMAFSRFQIERVTERNELTQRLMNLNGMGDDGSLGINGAGRVAGEKGREYVLVKNEGVEGGWALGVVSSKEDGERSKPIDVEAVTRQVKVEDEEEWEDDDDFEDVPIEGLNRLPKRADTSVAFGRDGTVAQEIAERRRAFYKSRRQGASSTRKAPKPRVHDPESLFVAEEEDEEVWENVDIAPTNDDLFEEQQEDEDEELSRAIALSLQQEGAELNHPEKPNDYMEVFEQARADEPKPLPKGSGMAIAHIANSRANKAAPVPQAFPISDSDEDDIDLQTALAESRKSKYKPHRVSSRPVEKVNVVPTPSPASTQLHAPQSAGLSGPLAFEKLDLGSSLLGKKKMKQLEEEKAGGFETDINKTAPKPAEPLPPWFSGDIRKDVEAQKAIEDEDREQQRQLAKQFRFQEKPKLRTQDSREVIDLDAPKSQSKEVINVDSDGEDQLQGVEMEVIVEDPELRMGDLADLVRAEPPQQPDETQNDTQTSQRGASPMRPPALVDTGPQEKRSPSLQPSDSRPPDMERQLSLASNDASKSDEELYEWEVSDTEKAADDRDKQKQHQKSTVILEQPEGEQTGVDTFMKPVGGSIQFAPSRTSSLDSVNGGILIEPEESQAAQKIAAYGRQSSMEEDGPIPMFGTADQNLIEADNANDDDTYSDPEDEELMMQLAIEAEEHARFASTMNNKTQKQNIEDYERELKQLRTQQKKDRRDADEVTHIMMTECQQLLKLFGLPYITAPRLDINQIKARHALCLDLLEDFGRSALIDLLA
ncbi:hypothetical protein B0A49_10938 [Cryomyces minteri]|uniref:XPG N-terminal domain-containing protein n=1 Tax=Cryomyces minteri TaxID=331657 RepID=A0A4U0WFK0_9PEZI|nr:hypothetical protein B0A49_10938 [Cryomyces minteri]